MLDVVQFKIGANEQMKPIVDLLAVHKTFEKEGDGKKAVIWYLYNGENTTRLNPKNIIAFLQDLKPGVTIRFTAVNALDIQLQELADRGVNIIYAHWHTLSLPKGLPPEEIVVAYFNAAADLFRPFKGRRDIAELRALVSSRNAIVDLVKAAIQQTRQAGRNQTDVEGSLMKETLDYIKKIKASFKTTNSKGKDVAYDTRIAELAKTIPECDLFNSVVGFKDYGTAAAVVSVSGGFDRFPMVSSVWKFYGLTPDSKRKKGVPCTHSPRGKVALYLMMESIMKNKKKPWRSEVMRIYEEDLDEHATKHPECKKPKGHSINMAKMKVKKEIMKKFFLAVKCEKFIEGHKPTGQALAANA